MKNRIQLLLAVLVSGIVTWQAAAQGTAFTYQGRLNEGASPALGIYDLRFTIYDSTNSPGTIVAGPLTNSATGISNGLFAVTLDFGAGIFTGPERWLEIGVRTNGGGGFTALSPRQFLAPAPQAIFANTASNLLGPLGAGQLAGTYGNPVSLNNAANNFNGSFYGQFFGSSFIGGNFVGSFIGSGNGLSDVWHTGGNLGTTPGVSFLGTTDNQPLFIKVNGQVAERFEPTSDTPNIIGGYSGNFVQPGLPGVTIGGGGTVLGSQPNLVTNAGNYATIAGGYGNTVSGYGGAVLGGSGNFASANFAAIGAGQFHTALGGHSWIGGGQNNIARGGWAVIAGGYFNTNNGLVSFIGAGYFNLINSNASFSTIGGGEQNMIGFGADHSTVGGGQQNVIEAGAYQSVIAGGAISVIKSNAQYSTISGGGFSAIASDYGTISGGGQHYIHSNSFGSTIGGGYGNNVETNASYSTISGGIQNMSYGVQATIGGGQGNTAGSANVTIGGGGQNVALGLTATIAGGFQNQALNTDTTVGGGYTNVASGYRSTIAGGALNRATASWTTIGGGEFNAAMADIATVSGGYLNIVSNNSYQATIGGGNNNTVRNESPGSIIGGGSFNIIEAFAPGAIIDGGFANTNAGINSVIGGGVQNRVLSSAESSVIGGGYQNTIQPTALYAVIPGGNQNIAGANYSFAAGYLARAINDGTFVWADSQGTPLTSTSTNQFLVRAQNGVGINTNNPQSALHVNGIVTAAGFSGPGVGLANVDAATLGGIASSGFWKTTGNAGTTPGTHFVGTTDGQRLLIRGSFVGIGRSTPITAQEFFGIEAPAVSNNFGGMYINTTNANAKPFYGYAEGGVPTAYHYVDGGDAFKWKLNLGSLDRVVVTTSGFVGIGNTAPTNLLMVGTARCDGLAWINASDRSLKENFSTVDSRQILDKVVSLPIAGWNYKADAGSAHLGPMAQDFHAAFGLGADNKSIATVDESGVALAAIQGLNQKLTEELKRRDAENADLKKRLEKLEQLMNQMNGGAL